MTPKTDLPILSRSIPIRTAPFLPEIAAITIVNAIILPKMELFLPDIAPITIVIRPILPRKELFLPVIELFLPEKRPFLPVTELFLPVTELFLPVIAAITIVSPGRVPGRIVKSSFPAQFSS